MGGFFRTLPLSVMIGLSLALRKMVLSHAPNYTAIGSLLVVLFCLFSLEYGARRWTLLLAVITGSYFGSLHIFNLPYILSPAWLIQAFQPVVAVIDETDQAERARSGWWPF